MSLLNNLNKSLGQLACNIVPLTSSKCGAGAGNAIVPKLCVGLGCYRRSRVARNYGVLARKQLVLTTSSSKLVAKRTVCGRENCADPCDWPPCAERNLSKKPECDKKRSANRMNIYEAYWSPRNDECCLDPCRWAYPRFDDLYYMENDKEKRVYTQTWVECPEFKIVPKRVCCYEQGIAPVICRRPKKERPKTACEAPVKCDKSVACPRIELPCCCKARVPPKCTKGKEPPYCKKFCAPYPSYSECNRDKPKKRHPVECFCLRAISTCEYYAWLRDQRNKLLSRDKCY